MHFTTKPAVMSDCDGLFCDNNALNNNHTLFDVMGDEEHASWQEAPLAPIALSLCTSAHRLANCLTLRR